MSSKRKLKSKEMQRFNSILVLENDNILPDHIENFLHERYPENTPEVIYKVSLKGEEVCKKLMSGNYNVLIIQSVLVHKHSQDLLAFVIGQIIEGKFPDYKMYLSGSLPELLERIISGKIDFFEIRQYHRYLAPFFNEVGLKSLKAYINRNRPVNLGTDFQLNRDIFTGEYLTSIEGS